MNEFLLIGQRPTETVNGAQIGRADNFFFDGLSKQFNTALIYPQDPFHITFCGAVSRKNQQFEISILENFSFNNTNFPNLLFFNHILETPSRPLRFMKINDRGGQVDIVVYHPITSQRGTEILKTKKIDFDNGEPLWQQYSELHQRLFIQEYDNNHAIPEAYSKVIVQPLQRSLPNTAKMVWVNPVCLRLRLTGDELNRAKFHLWTEDTEPLWLEPLFQQSQAPRIYFYQYGFDKINARTPSKRSRMEQLIWGTPNRPDNYPYWQAFAALEVLPGQFVLDNQSHYHWQISAQLTANAKYFADYWLKRWHGNGITDLTDGQMIESPSYTNRFRDAVSSPGISLNNEADNETNYHHTDTLFACFRLLDKPIFRVVQAVLSRCPKDMVANRLHRGYLRVRENQDEHYTLAFNAQAYLHEFARRYIAPLSPIRIDFPSLDFLADPVLAKQCQTQQEFYHNAIKNQHFNPIDSTFHGARGFFQQLSVSVETGLQDEPEIPAIKLGWWNHWHEYLYQNSSDSPFQLELQYTRVGHAHVGEMTYVGGYSLYQQTEKMCF